MMPVLSREINGKYVTEPCSHDALNMISWFAQGYTRNKISGFYRRTSQFFVLFHFNEVPLTQGFLIVRTANH